MITPIAAMLVLWPAWAVSWLIAAVWSSRAEARASLRDQLPYRALTVISAVLILWPVHRRLYLLAWVTPAWLGWLLVLVAVLGFAFAWWARIHLGRLWSGTVTRKADHRIVDTGPYGLVRHPIYTGILLALYAAALLHGTYPALLGGVVATLAFYVRARLEERFLRAELGPEYDAYRARVPMLVPSPRGSTSSP
jgi:protein-S-isoprenylcysteine O-methyltransferase Ste14